MEPEPYRRAKNTGILLTKIKKLTKTRNLVKLSAKSAFNLLRKIYHLGSSTWVRQMAFHHAVTIGPGAEWLLGGPFRDTSGPGVAPAARAGRWAWE